MPLNFQKNFPTNPYRKQLTFFALFICFYSSLPLFLFLKYLFWVFYYFLLLLLLLCGPLSAPDKCVLFNRHYWDTPFCQLAQIIVLGYHQLHWLWSQETRPKYENVFLENNLAKWSCLKFSSKLFIFFKLNYDIIEL